MDPRVGGQSYLVTGGTRGIGLATTRLLLDEGASVMVAARTTESIERAAADLGENPRVGFVEADLRHPEGADRAVTAASERFGELDGVVNNAAGFAAGGGHPDRAAWTELFELKLLGYESVIQAALGRMRDGGGFVNVSGIASMRHWPGSPHVSAINAGVEALSRHYAAELAGRRIRVNTVVPGVTATDRYRMAVQRVSERDGIDPAAARERLDGGVPLGRATDPAEVAATIVFLLSEHSASTTGATVVVDGGTIAAPGTARVG
ncbi:SDR family NAD(P)-dependent oxidoreductase [Pseudonocardia acaciae]|uniref:SDR family NAD(P)-dependent oxidoreductase n=1 Tax=Pseudonocardia acaciae TaxID=551276 RepID=UPI00048CC5A6|nr:SDR family oxidoreductase [Pseudonocardia acaciae]